MKRANDSQFLTINEKRHLVGFDSIPGGDELVSHNPNPSAARNTV